MCRQGLQPSTLPLSHQCMSGGGSFVPVVTSSTVFHLLVELRPFIKSINVNVVVIKKVEEKFTKEGHAVHSFLVADQSASILLNLWDEIGAAVLNGDILQILGGFVTLYKGFIRLGCKVGKVIYMGRFLKTFSLEPNMSMVTWTPDPKSESTFIPKFPKPTDQSTEGHPLGDKKDGGRSQDDEFQARIDAMLEGYPGLEWMH